MRDLESIVREVKEDMKKMGVPYNNRFHVMIRDYHTVNGVCYHDRELACIDKGLFNHGKMMDVKQTICHELIHSACGFNEHHGEVFQHYARRMDELGYDIHTRNNLEWDKRKEYKYVLYCPECGMQWGYRTYCKTIKYPERYCCNTCKCALKSERGYV